MPNRRILSLWFPRLGAERLLRQGRMREVGPFAVVKDLGQMQVLSSLSQEASAAGLYRDQPIRDAQAICPNLVTRLQNEQAEALFLRGLARWSGKFTPWISLEPPDSLLLDITGCSHLFGGEEALLEHIESETRDLGISVQTGLADTAGAAWALARYVAQSATPLHSGDAIDQEARATRARAVKRRHWERGGAAPRHMARGASQNNIAAPGKTHSAIKSLPVASLRLEASIVDTLSRLGLRHIGDLTGQPRAALARRFGKTLVEHLDKALGSQPEPISPLKAIPHFGVRLSFPDPIGLREDICAAIERLSQRLCTHLKDQGQGARRLMLQCFHTEGTMSAITAGLAKPSDDPERLLPVLLIKVEEIEAGFGIDMMRLEALETEAIHATQAKGQMALNQELRQTPEPSAALDDLIGRIGGRIGLEQITRYHPADSHIPEKGFKILAAAWSDPAPDWPKAAQKRPPLLWHPEIVHTEEGRRVPREFKWRGRILTTKHAQGPERIAPEWWLDDPNWRSGVRDYWQVTCHEGDLLWLFYAHGAALGAGWFCQGRFV